MTETTTPLTAPDAARPTKSAATGPGRPRTTARLLGLDVARGLAVLGMFAAHSVPGGHWLPQLVSGRSAALFAVLAGVSIALLSGGRNPQDRSWAGSATRIATRALLLFPLGLVLASMQVPARVILAFYAVLFLLSLPLLRLRATALGVLAGCTALAGPLASFWIRRSTSGQVTELGVTPSLADMTSPNGLGSAFQAIFLTGAYPVLTWLPFLLAGMALGRLDLRATSVRAWLVGTGAALGVLGYGGSWLALHVFGGMERILAAFGDSLPPELIEMVISTSGSGTSSTVDPAMLLLAAPHTGTPFDVVGAGGCAIAAIGACLLISDRVRVLVTPLASVGALALTAYVGHLLALLIFGADNLADAVATHPYLPWLVLALSTVTATAVWRFAIGRGPLEWILHRTSSGAAALVQR